MNQNFTILIQGKILPECLNHYVKQCSDFNVIVSTWVGSGIKDLPPNFYLIESEPPIIPGNQNVNLQIKSTLEGLNLCKTPFVIKVRGDEYYSNLDYVCEKALTDTNKIFTTPVFFRRLDQYPYHISDHLITGKTDNVRMLFDKIDYYQDLAECTFTSHYLRQKENTRKLPSIHAEAKIMMMKYFDILNLNQLKDYKVVANCFNKVWYNNFDMTGSVSNINEI